MQRGIEVLLGTSAAMSSRLLGRAWFDALARHESQVEGLAAETNAARAEAQAMAKASKPT